MARLADELQREPLSPPGWAFKRGDPEHNAALWQQTQVLRDYLLSAIREGVVIAADNVAEYFYAGNDQEEWDLTRDFPTLAPPFDRFFVEWRRPSRIVSRECGVRSSADAIRQTGMLCTSRPIDEFPAKALHAYAAEYIPPEELGQRLRWWLEVTWVAEAQRGRYCGPLATYCLLLDSAGQLLGRHTVAFPQWYAPDPPPDHFTEWIGQPLHPLAMVLSFLHCKNVALNEKQPDAALSRAHQRRHGKPLTRYHVLEIEPMKQVLRVEGQSEKTGLKRALHVCRGHFADYREGQGLFGKYHGRYWVPMHARGSIKEGIVAKDYAVKRPASAKVLTVEK